MNNLLPGCAAFLIALSILLFAWPTPQLSVPALTSQNFGKADDENAAPDALINPDLFDLASLPAAHQPGADPAHDDPAGAIRTFRLLGVSVNETGAIALIGDDTERLIVRTGDQVEGFTASIIEARHIDFVNGDQTVSLELPDDAAPYDNNQL